MHKRYKFYKRSIKSVVIEKFSRSLKSKIYKYMTSISENVYIDNLVDILI